MRSFWHDFFGLNDIHLPNGPLLTEQWRAFSEIDFPEIKPLDLPAVKPLMAKRAKRKLLRPVLTMKRRA